MSACVGWARLVGDSWFWLWPWLAGDLCGCGDLWPGWGDGPPPLAAAAGCRFEELVLGLGVGFACGDGPVGIGAKPYKYKDKASSTEFIN